MNASYRMATAILALAVSLGISPASAHETTGSDLTACDRLAVDEEAVLARTEPLELPAGWAQFSRSTVHWLAFATEAGGTHCSDIGWVEHAREFAQFQDRFAGFEWIGYEA